MTDKERAELKTLYSRDRKEYYKRWNRANREKKRIWMWKRRNGLGNPPRNRGRGESPNWKNADRCQLCGIIKASTPNHNCLSSGIMKLQIEYGHSN